MRNVLGLSLMLLLPAGISARELFDESTSADQQFMVALNWLTVDRPVGDTCDTFPYRPAPPPPPLPTLVSPARGRPGWTITRVPTAVREATAEPFPVLLLSDRGGFD